MKQGLILILVLVVLTLIIVVLKPQMHNEVKIVNTEFALFSTKEQTKPAVKTQVQQKDVSSQTPVSVKTVKQTSSQTPVKVKQTQTTTQKNEVKTVKTASQPVKSKVTQKTNTTAQKRKRK